MESSATEAARKKANALLAERAAIVKVGVDECLKCTVEVPSEMCHLCDQPAIMRNRGHCAACASFWIPALNRPGSLLLTSALRGGAVNEVRAPVRGAPWTRQREKKRYFGLAHLVAQIFIS